MYTDAHILFVEIDNLISSTLQSQSTFKVRCTVLDG